MASAAGCISGQWNGALTGSSMPRLAPRGLAVSMQRSTAALWPLTTTWPPPLSLATVTTSPCAASLQASCAGSSSMPSRAAIAPSPTGTAFCIDWPRSFRSRAASASCRAPAAVSAEYSPSEWPATWLARLASGLPPSFSRTRMTAMLTAISAGWAFSVRTRSDSGPSRINFDRFCFSASSISWKTSRAVAKAPARSTPMPTAWDPCPGKTKARPMSRFPCVLGFKRPSS